MRSILVTGGTGFIGANFVHFLINETAVQVINLDKLTYAGNPDTLAPLRGGVGTSSSRAISATVLWCGVCSETTGWTR